MELPEDWIPADSRVEIDAKITAGKTCIPRTLHAWPVSSLHGTDTSTGYFTTGKKMTEEELKAVQGRMWEE